MQPVDAGLTVGEAATLLGISIPALRKRIRRGTVQAHKVDGIWRVSLPVDLDAGSPPDTGRGGEATGQDAVISELRERVAEYRDRVQFLERLTEYQAGVIGELTRRVPELPAGSSAPEPSPTTPHTAPETAATPPVRRPWWRRWFGA